MQGQALTAWMLEENAKVHQLSGELREIVSQPPRGSRAAWIKDLQGRFGDFAGHLRWHERMEENGGYLTQVAELRPTLSKAVETIRHEHQELTTILEEVQAAVESLTATDNLVLRDCCRRIEHFLSWIERHEEHENHIVIYAFTQDLGMPG